jgi:hypothetical protein
MGTKRGLSFLAATPSTGEPPPLGPDPPQNLTVPHAQWLFSLVAKAKADRTAQLQTALNGKHSAQRPAPQICISHGTVPIATRHLET